MATSQSTASSIIMAVSRSLATESSLSANVAYPIGVHIPVDRCVLHLQEMDKSSLALRKVMRNEVIVCMQLPEFEPVLCRRFQRSQHVDILQVNGAVGAQNNSPINIEDVMQHSLVAHRSFISTS